MGLRICMLAITALTLAMLIKQWKSDFLPFVRLAIALAFSILLVSAAAPVVIYIQKLMNDTSASTYASVLVKALGIAVLTQCCSEICKECGENGIATGVELVGKIEILLLCLPLINEILTLAKNLMSIGNA